MISVVTWKWFDKGFRSTFTAETVNVMRSMVARNYPRPHRFICITDDPTGLVPEIEVVPLWRDYRDTPSPYGGGNPACYVRLKAFAPEMREILGDRFVSIDLDAVIVGDLRPIFDRPDPFVIWRHHLPRPGRNGPKNIYNGSLWMMDAGARADVWTRFTDASKAREAFQAGYHASDQGWMQYVLGPQEATWTIDDGVLSYRYQVLSDYGGTPPPHARIVFFHGKPDPWDRVAFERHDWIREHWH